MNSFRYAFYSTARTATGGDRGTPNTVINTENLIERHLAFPPSFPANDPRAIDDERCVVVGVNTSEVLQGARSVNIIVPTRGYPARTLLAASDFILQLPFLSDAEGGLTQDMRKGARSLLIKALPSRINPEIIAAASEKYLEAPENSARFSPGAPITAFFIGNLSQAGMDPSLVVERMRTLMANRGGHAVVSAYDCTETRDELRVLSALGPWVADSATRHTKDGRPNPYPAFLGLPGEKVLTGDSWAIAADIKASGQPFRVIHGWPQDLIPDAGFGSDNVRFLIATGARVNNPTRADVLPPIKVATGLEAAADKVGEELWRRARIVAALTPGPGSGG